MEENQNQEQVIRETPVVSSGFAAPQKSSSNSSKWLIIFILLLIAGGAGIFFFTKSSSEPVAVPTPSFGVVPVDENDKATSTPQATSTPKPVDKEDVSIEIQNGTGITGEAAFLQGKLKNIGYEDIEVGNAQSTDNTETTVTFAKSLSSSVQDELKKELESIFKTVNVKTSSTQSKDVVIITGLRNSQTSKPTATSTAKATATSSATPKPSATPTTNP